jgi:alkylation response protein AidB-like acyl-CoA dehydrogenase
MTVFNSDELDDFTRSVGRFVDDRYGFVTHRRLAASVTGFGTTEWSAMAELGWLALPVDAGHGGMGGGATETAVIMEAIGCGLLLEPYLASVVLAGGLIGSVGSDAQKSEILPTIASGKAIYAFAHEEFETGRFAEAVLTNGIFRISGAKMLVLHGDAATKLLVSAQYEGGQSLFLVDGTAPGVVRTVFTLVDNRRAADIRFDDVAVQRLGGSDSTTQIAAILDRAVAALCAEAVGAMGALNAMTLAFTKTRQQFGVPIGSFQVVQHRLVDMAIAEAESGSIARAATDAIDAGHPHAALVVSAAKIRINRASRFIGESAVQLHGGMGIAGEQAVGNYFKRLLLIGSLFGDCDVHLDRLAVSA